VVIKILLTNNLNDWFLANRRNAMRPNKPLVSIRGIICGFKKSTVFGKTGVETDLVFSKV
jgi:hypothetical protein